MARGRKAEVDLSSFWSNKRVVVTGEPAFSVRLSWSNSGRKAAETSSSPQQRLRSRADGSGAATVPRSNPDIVIHLAARVGGSAQTKPIRKVLLR